MQNPQVEIIKHDKTVGNGVQKTLAYDTPFNVEQLENWRKEFWGKFHHFCDDFSFTVYLALAETLCTHITAIFNSCLHL